MYFDMIPKIYYDSKADNNFTLLTNLMTRVKLRTDIKNDIFDFDYYDVVDGETVSYTHLTLPTTSMV